MPLARWERGTPGGSPQLLTLSNVGAQSPAAPHNLKCRYLSGALSILAATNASPSPQCCGHGDPCRESPGCSAQPPVLGHGPSAVATGTSAVSHLGVLLGEQPAQLLPLGWHMHAGAHLDGHLGYRFHSPPGPLCPRGLVLCHGHSPSLTLGPGAQLLQLEALPTACPGAPEAGNCLPSGCLSPQPPSRTFPEALGCLWEALRAQPSTHK